MATKSGVSPPLTLPPFLSLSREEIHTKFVELEWLQRERMQEGQQNSDPPTRYTRMAGDVATARNRYLNVEPFALHRVRLPVPEGANDYINASPIELDSRRFIATQGPKDATVNHFYRMVAAETRGPAVIVMLTQTHESGREKCSQYYPLTPEESPLAIPRDDAIADGFEGEVALLSVRDDAPSRSQLRHLRLRTRSPSGEAAPGDGFAERDVYHLLFAGWPDFLVPEGEDRTALLELLRLSASLTSPPPSGSPNLDPSPTDPSPPSSSPATATTTTTTTTAAEPSSLASALAATDPLNPRIIHCSAGVGRSGTFIALDILLSRLHAGEWDGEGRGRTGADEPVCEVVDSLRRQRMMMVQGEMQFQFLYEVLREQFEARMRVLNEGAEGTGGG